MDDLIPRRNPRAKARWMNAILFISSGGSIGPASGAGEVEGAPLTYQQIQNENYINYENLCNRCGSCCGAHDGDLCSNLVKELDNKYYCKIYNNRLGLQKTQSGRVFTCVDIRNVIKFAEAPPTCVYR